VHVHTCMLPLIHDRTHADCIQWSQAGVILNSLNRRLLFKTLSLISYWSHQITLYMITLKENRCEIVTILHRQKFSIMLSVRYLLSLIFSLYQIYIYILIERQHNIFRLKLKRANVLPRASLLPKTDQADTDSTRPGYHINCCAKVIHLV
jgi:hypothetical protein